MEDGVCIVHSLGSHAGIDGTILDPQLKLLVSLGGLGKGLHHGDRSSVDAVHEFASFVCEVIFWSSRLISEEFAYI